MRRLATLALLASVAACGPRAPSCTGVCVAPTLTTLALVAGQPGGPGSVDGIGLAAHFADPWTFAGDGAGKLYIVDGSIIRAVDETTGMVTTLAGTYGPVGGVDGVGPAASFFQPGGAVYAGGTLYVSDTEDDAIRVVDVATATVTTYAGQIAVPGAVDGDVAAARFKESEGIALDGGSLYLADTDNATIRRIVLLTGVVSTIAGSAGVVGSVDGVGAAAGFDKPQALTADHAGHLYVVDGGSAKVRVVNLADDAVTTRATLALPPAALAWDGTELVASLADHRVARIDAAGNVTTVAGAAGVSGIVDGAAADARFNRPAGLWIEGGRILVADDGNAVVRAIAGGAVTTLFGASSVGAADGNGADARFAAPQGLAVDRAGATAYVADSGNDTVRKVTLTDGAVTTLAGAAGQATFADGSGADARFSTPIGLVLDERAHRLYVADSGNRSIRVVDLKGGAVTTLPTNGAPGSMFARFNSPAGLAGDGARLYVSDSADHVVVAVDLATNLVTNVAGTPRTAGASDGVGMHARFNAPSGLAVDGRGALYVADVLNDAVRKIDLATGTVTTAAGVLGIRGADDGPATSAHFAGPVALAVDGLGHVFVADGTNALVREIDLAAARLSTVVGTLGLPGVRLGPLPAQLGPPTALALTADGHLLITSENALLIAR